MELPAEDRPDTIDIGLIRGIPIIEDDDPRLAADRAAWSAATRIAQALHSADELLSGLRHHDWRVRHQSVARLVARAPHNPRTLPTLLDTAVHDRSWQVRDAVIWGLHEFPTGAVLPALQTAAHDPHRQVRWSAQFALFQKETGPYPGPFDHREEGEKTCESFNTDRVIDDS